MPAQRMIVSLLAMPGTDPADERELLERFVRAVLDDDTDEPSRGRGRRR